MIRVFDIGGTMIKTGLMDEKEVFAYRELKTPGSATQLMEKLAEEIKATKGVEGIGIATRGQVDTEKGIMIYDPPEIIEGYTGTNFYEELASSGLPVTVENDANCAGYAEASHYPECSLVLAMTIGTGIGGAIVRDGIIEHGAHFSAGEFGVIRIRGKKYESVASTTALIEAAKAEDETIQNGRQMIQKLSANRRLQYILEDWTGIVAEGVVSLIHAFDPSVFVLGGGIMENSSVFDLVKVRTKDMIEPGFNCRIEMARQGNRAGMIGAGLLAQKRIGKPQTSC